MRRIGWSLVAFLVAAAATASAQSHYWIFFHNRSPQTVSRTLAPQLGISKRALWRRAKVLPAGNLLDQRDLPVSAPLIEQVRSSGATILTASRWLNAVSVEATPAQLAALQQNPAVAAVRPVATLKHPPERRSPLSFAPLLSKRAGTWSLNYGLSGTQLANINVVATHDLGIYGKGIIVGIIDNGFNNHRTHSALKNIRVLNEYDFIHRITDTERQPWEPVSEGNHGAATLSALAGYDEGRLIGAAFDATMILAKTEMDSTEVPAEEDLYVEALEWMEQQGADVVSSSLGYIDWYTYDSLDGKTAITTKAARVAASKGVLLVTAMGNEGNFRALDVTGTMIAPADADSILSVGAAYSDGILAEFSSTGPTFDGRIKPEVVAQGVGVVAADGTTTNSYVGASGTSLSTPLVAGAAALIFSAHPELTPMQVRAALMNTATPINDTISPVRSNGYPNDFYGYGMVNTLKALLTFGIAMSNEPMVIRSPTTLAAYVSIVSDTALVADSLQLHYRSAPGAPFQVVPLSTTAVPNLFSVAIPLSTDSTYPQGFITAADARGRSQAIPYGAPDSLFVLNQYIVSGIPGLPLRPMEFILNQNYPNPFNGGTSISFDAAHPDNVELYVYDILGRRVRTVYRGPSVLGRNVFHWDGLDERGATASSGVYFYQLRTSTMTLTNKMILLR